MILNSTYQIFSVEWSQPSKASVSSYPSGAAAPKFVSLGIVRLVFDQKFRATQ